MTGILEEASVMVVDDSNTMRRIICRFLENCGTKRILEARNGKEALDIFISEKVDLVISDLNMPRMNGLELLEAVRTQEAEEGGRVCFVMLTVEAVQKTMNLALDKGADSYIVKPVTERVFIEAVVTAMEGRRPEG